jgi:hypothetical protein
MVSRKHTQMMTMRRACGFSQMQEHQSSFPSLVCRSGLAAPVDGVLAFLFGRNEQDFVHIDMHRLSHRIDNGIRDILAL